ncbi:hypothetical protein GGS24DRAFT_175625 [Hypoxylon argillaceum]|nr:hypothetical protein GGS24DRAFT_175625 [Hypoxylon argillaceum]KAI1148188.1 hypothetical protein F4825DRAFT_434789 [Nemania diffusa]
MFTVRSSHGRALYSPLLLISPRSLFSSTCHPLAAAAKTAALSRYTEKAVLTPKGPVAEQLHATGVWAHGRGRAPPPPKFEDELGNNPKKRPRRKAGAPTGDKARVNVTSEKLCDDILSYVGRSLERHRGCDILDIYPGAGLWSSKLHDFLKPRSHILLEPDTELYRPFLQPLLDKPGTRLVPKSGIIWRELNSVLTPEFLPHQIIPDNADVRNDTLLVTANLSFHPKKRFLNFDSIASLVLHQFVHAIHSSGLFQRYGLVRMLIWTRTDDKLNFIPRNIQRRKRQALENDLVCEWVQEVCGGEAESGGWYIREDAINSASLIATIRRMRAAKLKMPPGREPEGFQDALAIVKARKRGPVPGKELPTFKRPYYETLANLRAADSTESGLAEEEALRACQWRANADDRKAERQHHLTTELDKIIALYKAKKPSPKQIKAAELAWTSELRDTSKAFMDEFITYKDNLHAWRQTPPLLQWDRRDYEPMTVEAEEFFPNVHCSLLDIQPKPLHPLLRQTGPNSNRAADMFDIILGSLMHLATGTLDAGLNAVWPGSSDYILPRWTSAQDLTRGGFLPHLRFVDPTTRLLNERQLEQLLELWMEWPFRPEFHDLVGRMQDDMPEKFDDAPNTEL